MTRNKNFIDYFFVMGLFCFGLYYYCFRILGFDLSHTPGDYGDSRFINYVLEHGFKWLKGEDPDFWRAGFMYPLKNNIAISDSMAGALPVYALFRFMRFDTETAYQLWWLSTCILNFWCCFIAFKKLGFNYFLGAIGAYAFAFGINNFNQFPHLQFNYKFLIPVAVAALYLFLNTARLRHFIILILAVVLQFYASAYLGLMLAYFCMGFVLLYMLLKHNRQKFAAGFTKKTGLQCTAVAVAGILLLLIVAIPYHNMAGFVGYRNYETESLPNLPRIYSYFFANMSTLSWPFLKTSPLMQGPAWYLHDMFPGGFCYLGIVLAIIYFLKDRIQKKKISTLPLVILATFLLFALLMSKSESDFSLFYYFRALPGVDSMRLTSRFMIIGVFFLIWLSLMCLQRLIGEKGMYLYFFLTLLVIADNCFVPEQSVLSITLKHDRHLRVEKMVARINAANTEHKKIIACLNIQNDDEAFFQLDVMLACQQLNLKTLNGYSSTCYGNLCGAYNDPAHIKLLEWMKQYDIAEKDVLFISN